MNNLNPQEDFAEKNENIKMNNLFNKEEKDNEINNSNNLFNNLSKDILNEQIKGEQKKNEYNNFNNNGINIIISKDNDSKELK